MLTPVPNSRLTALLGDTVRVTMGEGRYLSGADFALFWDKDIRLARAMEACGVRLYKPCRGGRAL